MKNPLSNIKEQISLALSKKPCIDCMCIERSAGFLKRDTYRCSHFNVVIKCPHIADHDCAFFYAKPLKVREGG